MNIHCRIKIVTTKGTPQKLPVDDNKACPFSSSSFDLQHAVQWKIADQSERAIETLTHIQLDQRFGMENRWGRKSGESWAEDLPALFEIGEGW